MRFSKRPLRAVDLPRVRCADCAHFERADHPHMGRCAQGHGRYWLEDFEAAVEGGAMTSVGARGVLRPSCLSVVNPFFGLITLFWR
jgi:hypothetical protein